MLLPALRPELHPHIPLKDGHAFISYPKVIPSCCTCWPVQILCLHRTQSQNPSAPTPSPPATTATTVPSAPLGILLLRYHMEFASHPYLCLFPFHSRAPDPAVPCTHHDQPAPAFFVINSYFPPRCCPFLPQKYHQSAKISLLLHHLLIHS